MWGWKRVKIIFGYFPYFLRKEEEILPAETDDGRGSVGSLRGDDNVQNDHQENGKVTEQRDVIGHYHRKYLWKISKQTQDYWVSCSVHFGGVTLPFNVFYLFYNNVRKRKLLTMQMILNHWNANELCPVQRNRFFSLFFLCG